MDSYFTKNNGLFLRDPNGGVESLDLMKQAGWNFVACNVEDNFPPSAWEAKVIPKAKAAGMMYMPWQYIWNLGDLDHLLGVADDWSGGICIPNIEKQIDDGTYDAPQCADRIGDRDVMISTEAWLYGGVDWTALTKYPVGLQFFPFENGVWDFEGCIIHAHAMGFDCVLRTFGSYDVAGGPHSGGKAQPEPVDYGSYYGGPLTIYTCDDLTYDYPAAYSNWMPTEAYEPCKDEALPPLSEAVFPFTGPYYPLTPYPGQTKRLPDRGKTVKALKLIFNDLGMMNAGAAPNNVYGAVLRDTVFRWQQQCGIDPPTGNYGRKTWESLRTAEVDGDYAVSGEALRLIQEDAKE